MGGIRIDWEAPAAPMPCALLKGRWQLEPGPLEGGDPAGCGVLRLAADRATPGRVVVAKLERPEPDRAAQSRARLQVEHMVLTGISDRRVVAALDGGLAPETGGWYLILEHHPAGSLARLLRSTTWFSLGWALEVAAEALRALLALHESPPGPTVHRDVNPRNILVRDDTAEQPSLVLADFGLARDLGRSRLGRGGTGGVGAEAHGPGPGMDVAAARDAEEEALAGLAGGGPAYSPYYAPPELVLAEPPERSGVTTDLYQATALLYELVTGLPPYHWEVRSQGARFERLVLESPAGPLPASAVNPSLPRALDQLLAAGLAPLPERRPASAHELLERLPGLARRHGELPIQFAALRGRGVRVESPGRRGHRDREKAARRGPR
jgi:eukaryotic-like serine/threonine-protein kinase